ncbi:ketoacyl-ACP synthase III [Paenibacillus thalictri]|uniref:Beta-ketoacyl-[acyl-carrier-protein] synthase III n=1 Tax=Paenibacillus thalictri TaxID=2527873 RepID=A0A4Q9DZ34_9BACL|nr:ketoacyl-ACP synthase III [Paenibacillus thalictri]TBL81735.1 ketoacyl-ACP synthase III [Paenibacillus thalictri]
MGSLNARNQDAVSPGPAGARITATGSYVPEQVLTNADLEKMVDTSDDWIVQRTGIRERRICAPDQFTSDLCIAAVRNLLDTCPQAELEDTDLIIVATHTPELAFPSAACLVQGHFGLKQAGAMDLNATCAGFAYALHVANGLICAGLHNKVLVIGADALSKTTDYTDRTTCILFGDGAGAALLERSADRPGFIAYHGGADGSGAEHLYRTILTDKLKDKNGDSQPLKADGRIVQNGREVYRFAVTTVPVGVSALLNKAGMTAGQVDWFIPHSANLRIIDSVCEKTGLSLDKTLHTIERFGNTSAATIPLALDAAAKAGKLQDGDNLLMYGFGGGLVHAGLLWRWSC